MTKPNHVSPLPLPQDADDIRNRGAAHDSILSIEAARFKASDCEGAGIKTVRRIFQRGMADVPDLPSAKQIADADAWGALFIDITSGRRR